MAITGSRNKTDYKPARRWAFQCPCCMKAGAVLTYTAGENNDKRDCTKCVLNDYAWKAATSYDNIQCLRDPKSYFKLWDDSYTKLHRQYWAMRMVQACNRAIEDLIVLGRLHP